MDSDAWCGMRWLVTYKPISVMKYVSGTYIYQLNLSLTIIHFVPMGNSSEFYSTLILWQNNLVPGSLLWRYPVILVRSLIIFVLN